jgi:DNA-binding transcriptional LysR family regulator
MDRLTSMLAFTQVVEAESFSEAARRLGLSKSSVSKHVTQLEARLGVQLLHRNTRRLSLTEVGRAFYERCAQVVRQVEEAELEVGRAHTAPQGLLKLNAPMSFGQLWLGRAVAEFLRHHPKLRVDMVLDDRALNPVQSGFDVTIRVAPALADSSLIARRLAPNRLVVCGSPEYLARRGLPRTPADLAQHECLLYSYLSWGDTWRFMGRGGDEWVTVSGSFRANNGDVLREAALAGLGLAYMPSFIVGRDLARGALRAVLEGYEDRSTAIWLLYSPTRHVAARVRAFVDFLAERFAGDPPWDAHGEGGASGARRTPRGARGRGPRPSG